MAKEMSSVPAALMFAPAEKEITFEKMNMAEKCAGFGVVGGEFLDPRKAICGFPQVALKEMGNSQVQVRIHQPRIKL